MVSITSSVVLLFLYIQIVLTNVEKTIFLSPSRLQIPLQHPVIENLQLQALSPDNSSLRTELSRAFPTDINPKGETSWFILEGLTEGQRYEVRICWAAIQPTSFDLFTHELPEVFESPELVASLAEYSEIQRSSKIASAGSALDDSGVFQNLKLSNAAHPHSILFLRLYATADYYTSNRTLMENVPPVLVDIILDPYILNVFPRSLMPTAVYLVMIAIGGWFLAKSISAWLQKAAEEGGEKKNV